MFTEKMLKRFRHPRNTGRLKNANARSSARNFECNDYIEMYLKIEKDRIVKAKFKAIGCPGVISTTDVYIDLILGKSLDEALNVTIDDISLYLGGIPLDHWHCANLPLEALREAMKNYKTVLIGVSGGKGGTGKSTVATALAFGLAKKHKVLLVDADVGCPNDHLLLGLRKKLAKKVMQRIPDWDMSLCKQCGLCGSVCREKAILSLKKKNPVFFADQCNGCGACVLKCPQEAIAWSQKEIGRIYSSRGHNIDLLTGEIKSGEPIAEIVVSALNEMVEKKRGEYDYIIIDTAAGLHCDVIAALKKCHYALAVTEPTPLGDHDLRLLLKLFKRMKLAASIVINRADVGDKSAIRKLARRDKLDILAEVPYDKQIITSYSAGRPIEHPSITNLIKRFTR